MTTQPHDSEFTGATPDREQFVEPTRSDLPADPVATPAQPLDREPMSRADVPVDHEPVAQPDQPGDRQPVPQADAPVDRQPVPNAEEPVDHAREAHAQPDVVADESLFATGDLPGLRSRWDDVQAGFVDDPRKCVQTADGLVSDVVQQLTDGFSQARSRLEDQWARGEDVSTEDLRLALKRYREFFDRLLAV
jgi:hypothetical protein